MKNSETNRQREIKKSRFPASLFAIYLGVLFLMSGIHTGLIVFMNEVGWNEFLPSAVPMVYWGIVAVGLTLFTRKQIKRTYEEPLHKLAEATDQVANGDFSVYVPTIHTPDKWDYLDVMIMDFNKMVEELGMETEDSAMAAADESLLELVWNNLLSNAVKFTEPGGRITVTQTSDERYVDISVSDTGCGMDRESVKHIFDKFYQGDTSHSKEGNGLGLALVKRVLELSDGEIEVFSERGTGSTFHVRLPLAGISEKENGGTY